MIYQDVAYKVLYVENNYTLNATRHSFSPYSESFQTIFVDSVCLRVTNLSGIIDRIPFKGNPYVNVGDEITVEKDAAHPGFYVLSENITQQQIIDKFCSKKH